MYSGFGRTAAGAALACVCALFGAAGEAAAQSSGDYDCSDFSNQAAAQSFYISAGGPASDPHALDGDRDGVACETLPCPCASSSPIRPVVGPTPPPPAGSPTKLSGRVINVVDGDTIDVRLNRGKVDRVRLLGIDTPEVYNGPECGGSIASAEMRRLALNRRVKLTTDPTQDRRDRYGRLLAYVRRAGGGSIQAGMLRTGWAQVYVYDSSAPFQRLTEFRPIEDAAGTS